jgi:mono/diheme cytochrome c family protein
MGPGMMGAQGMMGGDGHMGMSALRHRHFMQNGIPDAYRNVRNPLSATPATLAAGRTLYAAHCATCHGPQGYGDGPAAKTMNPRPANIAMLARMPMASDAYLMWTISEGGAPVGSGMPAFKASLSETQRWQVATYVRSELGR